MVKIIDHTNDTAKPTTVSNPMKMAQKIFLCMSFGSLNERNRRPRVSARTEFTCL